MTKTILPVYISSMRLILSTLAIGILLAGCSIPGTSPQNKNNQPIAVKSTMDQSVGTTLNESDTLKPIRRFAPQYPLEQAHNGQPGCVMLKFDVTPSGKPVHIRTWSSIPKGVFDRTVIRTLRQWRFVSTKNGKPAWTYDVMQRFFFSMNNGIYPRAEEARLEQQIKWICEQPQPWAVRVIATKQAHEHAITIAYYGGETIAYLPAHSTRSLPAGSVRIGFCMGAKGEIRDAVVQAYATGTHHGLLGLATLAGQPFTPFTFQGSPAHVCHLIWSIPFTTAPPGASRDFPELCGCSPSGKPAVLQVTFVELPQLRKFGNRAMPLNVSHARHIGVVGATLCISATGLTSRVRLIQKSGKPGLDALARRVLGDFRFFSQHTDAGKPIASCGWHINVDFARRALRRES